MKYLIIVMILISISLSNENKQHDGSHFDRYESSNQMMITYYHKMFNIICYVHSNKDNMVCFDLDSERMKVKATGKDKKEREQNPYLNTNTTTSNYEY